MEKEFVFILGNARELAAYELKSVLGEDRTASFNVSENMAFINSEMPEEEIRSLIDVLGGTIKIGVRVQGVGTDHLQGGPGLLGGVSGVILDDLRANPARDIGFSFYKGKPIRQAQGWSRDRLFEIKNELKDEGIKTRLVLPKKDNILNAAEIRSNKLVGKGREYLICGDKVFATIAVQDIEEITERDFGKPRANAFSGMLPPKLARMMVNLAVGQNQKLGQLEIRSISNLPRPLVVVDPFCGSGNVLIEALDLGYQVRGSDISDKAVEWTRENLIWMNNELRIKNNGPDNSSHNSSASDRPSRDGSFVIHNSVFKGDATRDDFLKGVTDPFVIVTEPFLGKPKTGKIDSREADRELEQLAKLYLGFLENLACVIASDQGERGNLSARKIASSMTPRNDNIGVPVCLVFPAFELKNGAQAHLYNRIVDKIGTLGYIKLAGPFIYGRDYSVVKREVILFKLT